MSDARIEAVELGGHEDDYKDLYSLLYHMANPYNRSASLGIADGVSSFSDCLYSIGELLFDLGYASIHKSRQADLKEREVFGLGFANFFNQDKAAEISNRYLDEYNNSAVALRNKNRINTLEKVKESFKNLIHDAVVLQRGFYFNQVDSRLGERYFNSEDFNNALNNMKLRGEYTNAIIGEVRDEFHKDPVRFMWSLGTSWLLVAGTGKVLAAAKNYFEMKSAMAPVVTESMANVVKNISVNFKKSGLEGKHFFHGTEKSQAKNVLMGPKNIGEGFGGSGLCLTFDKRIADEYAFIASKKSGKGAKSVVLEGKIPEGDYKVASIKIARRHHAANLEEGIFPPDWHKDPILNKLIKDNFDILEVKGLQSGGYNFDVDSFIVVHERAGKNAIQWVDTPGLMKANVSVDVKKFNLENIKHMARSNIEAIEYHMHAIRSSQSWNQTKSDGVVSIDLLAKNKFSTDKRITDRQRLAFNITINYLDADEDFSTKNSDHLRLFSRNYHALKYINQNGNRYQLSKNDHEELRDLDGGQIDDVYDSLVALNENNEKLTETEKSQFNDEKAMLKSLTKLSAVIGHLQELDLFDSNGNINVPNMAKAYLLCEEIMSTDPQIERTEPFNTVVTQAQKIISDIQLIVGKTRAATQEIDRTVKEAKSITKSIQESVGRAIAPTYESHPLINDIFIFDSFLYQLSRMHKQLQGMSQHNNKLRERRDAIHDELVSAKLFDQSMDLYKKIKKSAKKNKKTLLGVSILDTVLSYFQGNPFAQAAKVMTSVALNVAPEKLSKRNKKRLKKLNRIHELEDELSSRKVAVVSELHGNVEQLAQLNHGVLLDYEAALKSLRSALQDNRLNLTSVEAAKKSIESSDDYKRYDRALQSAILFWQSLDPNMSQTMVLEKAKKYINQELTKEYANEKDLKARQAALEHESLTEATNNIQASIAQQEKVLQAIDTPAQRRHYEFMNVFLKSRMTEAQLQGWNEYQVMERALGEYRQVGQAILSASSELFGELEIMLQGKPQARAMLEAIRGRVIPGMERGLDLTINIINMTDSGFQLVANRDSMSVMHGILAFGVKGVKSLGSILGIFNLILGNAREDLVLKELREISAKIDGLKETMVECTNAVLTALAATESRLSTQIQQVKKIVDEVYNQSARIEDNLHALGNQLNRKIEEQSAYQADSVYHEKISKLLRDINKISNISDLKNESDNLLQNEMNGEQFVSDVMEGKVANANTHRYAGSYVGVLNSTSYSREMGVQHKLPNVDVLSLILHKIIDQYNDMTDKRIPKNEFNLVNSILRYVDCFNFSAKETYAVTDFLVSHALAYLNEINAIYQAIYLDSLFKMLEFKGKAFAIQPSGRLLSSPDIGYTFVKMLKDVEDKVSNWHVPELMDMKVSSIVGLPVKTYQFSYEKLEVTRVPLSSFDRDMNRLANIWSWGLTKFAFCLNEQFKVSIEGNWISSASSKYNIVHANYIGFYSISEVGFPYFVGDFVRHSAVAYMLLGKPIKTSAVSDDNFVKVSSARASSANKNNNAEKLDQRLDAYKALVKEALENKLVCSNVFGVRDGVLLSPNVKEFNVGVTMIEDPLPMIFPLKYIEMLLKLNGSIVYHNILKKKMDAVSYQASLYYTLEKRGDKYAFLIKLKDSEGALLFSTQVFNVDTNTLLAIRDYTWKFAEDKKSCQYQGHLSVNKFFVLFMYGSLECGLSIPSNGCVDLTGEGEYFYKHRPFVGIYRLLEAQLKKDKLTTIQYESNLYDDSSHDTVLAYLAGKQVARNECVNRLLFQDQVVVDLHVLRKDLAGQRASIQLQARINKFLSEYKKHYYFILTSFTILTSLKFKNLIDFIQYKYALPHPTVLENILFEYPIKDSIGMLDSLVEATRKVYSNLPLKAEQDEPMFRGEDSRYRHRLFKQADLIRTAIKNKTGVISGKEFELYKEEVKNITMIDLDDTTRGKESAIDFKKMAEDYAYTLKIFKRSMVDVNTDETVAARFRNSPND